MKINKGIHRNERKARCDFASPEGNQGITDIHFNLGK
jgi:hypothetical protein